MSAEPDDPLVVAKKTFVITMASTVAFCTSVIVYIFIL